MAKQVQQVVPQYEVPLHQNSKNYLFQIQALQKIQLNSKDREIEVEIQNLKKAESLIHQKLASDNAFSN